MSEDTAVKILNGIKLAVVIIVILAIAYVIFIVVRSSTISCIFNPIDCLTKQIGTPLQCPANMQDNKVGLCYEKCPAGYVWDGAQLCYKPCPSGWAGGETIAHCQHETKYSTIGTTGTDKLCKAPANGIAQRFPDNMAGLCYTLPDGGWEVSAPGFIARKCPTGSSNTGATCVIGRGAGTPPTLAPCPPGTRDDGTSCWDDIQVWTDCNQFGIGKSCPSGWTKTAVCTCQRGTGRIVKTSFDRQVCPTGQELQNGICYPKVDSRFTCAGPVCHFDRQVQSQVGTVPTECPPGRELHGDFCYPKCPTGFSRMDYNLEFCRRDAPPEFKDIGVGGYEKPSKLLPVAKSVIEVGVCPVGKTRKEATCVTIENPADQSWF